MELLKNYFVFDGITSSDYGIYISSGGAFNAPQRVYNMVSVPGRNGAIAIDEGRFDNTVLTYPAGVFGRNSQDMIEKVKQLRNQLLSRKSYCRLWDSYNPDEFRLAVFRSGLEVEGKAANKLSEFEIEFDCKPQRFLTSGTVDRSVSNGSGIVNPTLFESQPLIHVVGYGQFTIGSNSVTIGGSTSIDLYLDCETMEAYSYSGGALVNRNSLITLGADFPVLKPGTNGVTYANTIASLSITPRWWII